MLWKAVLLQAGRCKGMLQNIMLFKSQGLASCQTMKALIPSIMKGASLVS